MVRRPIVVDLFAGGGGASLGIRQALGVEPILAVNHCRHAINMHAANHPRTLHLHESVWTVHGSSVLTDAPDLLWASPDCTHFSRAKGKAPRSKSIRSLAWVVVDWARDVRPRVICMENVPEFTGWGPLGEDGQPIKAPAPTVTSGGGRGGGHAALCAAFLLKYYQQGGQWSTLNEPMHTLVSKARMGLVTVTLGGEEYALVDIGMRMLQPRELARAQGFPDSYVLIGNKSEQVARIGNSVCPPVAEALVRAQLPELARRAA